jgi:hypothetical protein
MGKFTYRAEKVIEKTFFCEDRIMKKCSRCSYSGPINSFPRKVRGVGYLQHCYACEGVRTQVAKASPGANKENKAPSLEGTSSLDLESLKRPAILSLPELLALLEEHSTDHFELDGHIEEIHNEPLLGLEDLDCIAGEAVAHNLSAIIRDSTGYRWK